MVFLCAAFEQKNKGVLLKFEGAGGGAGGSVCRALPGRSTGVGVGLGGVEEWQESGQQAKGVKS